MSPVRNSLDFAHVAKALGQAARRHSLIAPSFRSPPRIVGVDRSLRRYAGGAAVAVQLKGRPWSAVVGDMIEGVVVANRLTPPQSDRVRTDLWAVVDAGEASMSRVA